MPFFNLLVFCKVILISPLLLSGTGGIGFSLFGEKISLMLCNEQADKTNIVDMRTIFL
jgi:hypothetical protein